MSFPKRKHPWQGVLESEDRPTIVFLTVCTAARTSWLADQPIHETLKSIWWKATYWKVGPYVLMPDHLHLFAWPGILHAPFDPWVRYWKSQFSNTINNRSFRWQSNCFHHRLRSLRKRGSQTPLYGQQSCASRARFPTRRMAFPRGNIQE